MRKDQLHGFLSFWRERQKQMPSARVLHFIHISQNGRTEDITAATYTPFVENRRPGHHKQASATPVDDSGEELEEAYESDLDSMSAANPTISTEDAHDNSVIDPTLLAMSVTMTQQPCDDYADEVIPITDPILPAVGGTSMPASTRQKRPAEEHEDNLGRGKRTKILKVNFAEAGRAPSKRTHSRSRVR